MKRGPERTQDLYSGLYSEKGRSWVSEKRSRADSGPLFWTLQWKREVLSLWKELLRVSHFLKLLLQKPPLFLHHGEQCGPPSVWHCWHHADLILLRGSSMQPPRVRWRISWSLGAYFFAPPGSKSIVSRSQSHRLFFINIQTFPIAFKCSVKMKKSYKNIQINFWKIVK